MPKLIELTEADVVRFWSKVDKCAPDECWEWQAGRNEDGYGVFRLNGGQHGAHRVAYTITNGGTTMRVSHTCKHRGCCNPSHLYIKLDRPGRFEIFALRNLGWSNQKIAERCGFSQQQISDILRGLL